MHARTVALRVLIAGTLTFGLWWFDRFVEIYLYPATMAKWGVLDGLGRMIVFSFIVCLVLLLVYDYICSRDPTRIRNKWLRSIVEASNDVLGLETLKGVGASAWEDLFVPVRIVPAAEQDRVRLHWWWVLRIARHFHVIRALPSIRKVSEVARYVYALLDNLRLRAWEPIRRYLAAPLATALVRRGFETPARFLALSFLTDGMTTTILMRPARSHRFGPREWLLFVTSIFLSCLSWGGLVGAAVTVYKILTSSFVG